MDLYGIVGAGGFGREVIPLANKNLRMVSQGNFRLVFIDDGDVAKNVNGYDVLTTEKFLAQKAGERFFNIAIGNSRIREKVCNILLDGGARPFSISASNAVVLDGNELAEGSILCPFSMVTSNTRIGKFFHANIYSYVAHDCEIGDFVTFAPSVKCNGNVRIESHAYIGTGAVIKQGTPEHPIVIGEGAVVGMGAVVTKSVPAGAVVVGNPAKPLVRKEVAGEARSRGSLPTISWAPDQQDARTCPPDRPDSHQHLFSTYFLELLYRWIAANSDDLLKAGYSFENPILL